MQAILARLTINSAIIALIVAALAIQTVRIEGFKVWPISVSGYKTKLEDARAELKAISAKRNEQKAETSRNIVKVREQETVAERQAKRVESAPLPGNCQTPAEVIGADL